MDMPGASKIRNKGGVATGWPGEVRRCRCGMRGRSAARGVAATAVALSLSLLGAAGCNRQHSADVVATVNGHAIMRNDMEKAYTVQLGDAQGQQPSPEQASSLRLNVVRGLIEEEIVQQRATKMNLTATAEEVDAKLNEMKAPYTEEQFSELLKARHTTLDDLKHDLRRSLTIDKLLNKEINSKVSVSDSDVTDYFNQHKAEFDLIENQYHLAEIRVTNVPSPQAANLQNNKATNDADARKKIEGLKSRLDTGEDFGTLAGNYSERPETASNGGDMGFVPESQLHTDPAVYAAVSKLKAGQVTEVLPILDSQTRKPAGYAIYKLISREPAGQRDINDPRVQQTIRQELRDARSQLLKSAYLEILHDEAKIENFLAEEIFKSETK